MNKKILVSLSIVGVVAAVVFGITTAFFSDTETSTGNTFTAGTLDLKVDSTCHYDGMVCSSLGIDSIYVWIEEQNGSSRRPELLGQPCACTWISKDLDGDVFFNFSDIKPGDNGEDTISFDIASNPVWVCVYVKNIVDEDVTCTEPEGKDEMLQGGNPCTPDGELDENLDVTAWIDDNCNNVIDSGEEIIVQNELLSWYFRNQVIAIAASDGMRTTPLPAGHYCLGIKWNLPGIIGNIIQTDKVGADLEFYIEQSRNNPNFKCSNLLKN